MSQAILARDNNVKKIKIPKILHLIGQHGFFDETLRQYFTYTADWLNSIIYEIYDTFAIIRYDCYICKSQRIVEVWYDDKVTDDENHEIDVLKPRICIECRKKSDRS